MWHIDTQRARNTNTHIVGEAGSNTHKETDMGGGAKARVEYGGVEVEDRRIHIHTNTNTHEWRDPKTHSH